MRPLIAIVSLATVLSVGLTPDAGAQGPVRIGFLAPLSGAIAQAGKDMDSGCELYWEESGWQRRPQGRGHSGGQRGRAGHHPDPRPEAGRVAPGPVSDYGSPSVSLNRLIASSCRSDSRSFGRPR